MPSECKFDAHIFKEDDGSYTISLDTIDLAENAKTKDEAISALKAAIYEYAADFCKEFNIWSSAPNRKSHIPLVLKVLSHSNSEELELNIIS